MPAELITDPNNRPMEVFIDHARVSQMPDEIVWKEHDTRLVFTPAQEQYTHTASGATFPMYEMTGYVSGRKIPFTDKTSRKKILFAASNSAFMHDPSWSGEEETDYYIIGINPQELKLDMQHMLSVYHEIGHAHLVDQLLDVALLAVAITFDTQHLTDPQEFGEAVTSDRILLTQEKVAEYAKIVGANLYNDVDENELDQAFVSVEQGDQTPQISILKRMKKEIRGVLLGGLLKDKEQLDTVPNVFGISAQLFFFIMRKLEAEDLKTSLLLFHEKESWVIGVNMMIQDGFPGDFESEEEMLDYMNFRLKSYAKSHNDDRFVLP